MNRARTAEEEAITRAVVRMNAALTGIVLGLISGIGLFVATIWLVLKGGEHVGAHLGLLSQFFPGYNVTLAGAFIGFFWAFAVAFLAGWAVGAVYNRIAR